ncbi:hypothetical protein RMATCC62417_03280 [Rhizopus microsporus]|nr:hypothetical protein RMATCC62417_03280 [Rhizopus microsporus]
MYDQLNQQQKDAFDTIVHKIESDPRNSQFFLQCLTGTGKTFVYNNLCDYYKNECSTCNIRKDSDLVGLMQRAKLMIWDEVPMQHKYCFEAARRTFQDIRDDPEELYLFGGKPVVLGGDFVQIPPVV